MQHRGCHSNRRDEIQILQVTGCNIRTSIAGIVFDSSIKDWRGYPVQNLLCVTLREVYFANVSIFLFFAINDKEFNISWKEDFSTPNASAHFPAHLAVPVIIYQYVSSLCVIILFCLLLRYCDWWSVPFQPGLSTLQNPFMWSPRTWFIQSM